MNLLSYFYSSNFQQDYNYWNNFFWNDFQSTLGADVCKIGNDRVFYFGPIISETRRFQLPLFLAQESSKITASFNLCIIDSNSLQDLNVFDISFQSTDSDPKVLSSIQQNYNAFTPSSIISCSSGGYKCLKINLSLTISHIQDVLLIFKLLDTTKNERYLLREMDISVEILTDYLILDKSKNLCQAHSSFQNEMCQCDNGFYEKKLDAKETCDFFPCSYCAPCHGSCKTCSGKDIKSCLSCWNNYVYDNNLKTCILADKNSNLFLKFFQKANLKSVPIENTLSFNFNISFSKFYFPKISNFVFF